MPANPSDRPNRQRGNHFFNDACTSCEPDGHCVPKSGQIDIIIHDRTNVPALTDGHAWSIVPVEAVHAVVSVKTTLNKTGLKDTLDSIQSVRSLPRHAAVYYPPTGGVMKVLEKDVLRPRAYVFAFKSNWKNADSVDAALKDLLPGISDDYRPNGVCILDQGFIIRRAYKLDTIVFPQHALMHFFNHLVLTLSTRPIFSVDLSKYITEDYGILSPKGDAGSSDVKPGT